MIIYDFRMLFFSGKNGARYVITLRNLVILLQTFVSFFCSILMQDLDEAGSKNKEDILKNLEADQTFTAVNRRAAYAAGPSIITDVRHRNTLGSTENIDKLRKEGGTAATTTATAGSGDNKKGWFGGLLGGGDKSGVQEPPVGTSPKSMEEGQGRHRPKLH